MNNIKTTDWPMAVALPAAFAWSMFLSWIGSPVLPVLVLTVRAA